jgi:hypothetical protein
VFDADAVSPKFQDHVAIVPDKIEVPLVKHVVCPKHAGVYVKSTTGFGFMVTVF